MIHLLLVLACSTQVWFHQKFKIPCYTYFWIAMLYPSLGYLLLFHLLWGTYFCFIQFWGIQFCAPVAKPLFLLRVHYMDFSNELLLHSSGREIRFVAIITGVSQTQQSKTNDFLVTLPGAAPLSPDQNHVP